MCWGGDWGGAFGGRRVRKLEAKYFLLEKD